MIFKLSFFVIVLASDVLGDIYTPGSDQYLFTNLSHILSPLNPFDGPPHISNAPTAVSNNKQPSLDQMMYYNYYCASTYYGHELEDLTCEYCIFEDHVVYHKVINKTAQGTLALVTVSEEREEIVVAFCGTSNIPNVLLDVLLCLHEIHNIPKQIKVHHGYYLATMSLYDDVKEKITELLDEYPGFKVVLTGHSLGAAMARITFLLLANCKLFIDVSFELYTYGEPRCGNKYFAEFMNSKPIITARVVARADIFPHIYPTSVFGLPLFGDYYVHAHIEYWINGKADQKFCSQSVLEDPKCSMSMGPIYKVFDHMLYFDVNYARSFSRNEVVHLLLGPIPEILPQPTPIKDLMGEIFGDIEEALDPAFG